MGSHKRPPLPHVCVTHDLALARWLGPNMQEITWDLYLARWAQVLIWLEAEADWINLGENGVCGVLAEHFPPSFLGYSGLPGVFVVDEPEGRQWRLKKRSLWVLAAECCSTAQGPISAAQQGHLQCGWVLLRECSVGSIPVEWPWGCDLSQLLCLKLLSQLLCLKLDTITMLPSTLPPQASSQAPWLSHSSEVSQPLSHQKLELGGEMKDHPLGGHQSKVTFSKSSPCPSLSLLAVHQALPLPGGRPWHWLSPRRGDTHKTWNLHTEVFFLWSQLSEAVQEGSPCGYLPFMQLSCSRCVGNYLQRAWFTAHKIRLVLDQTPWRICIVFQHTGT